MTVLPYASSRKFRQITNLDLEKLIQCQYKLLTCIYPISWVNTYGKPVLIFSKFLKDGRKSVEHIKLKFIHLFYKKSAKCRPLYFALFLGSLMRRNIANFHYTCFGTEIFLHELTFQSTLSSNPKTSRTMNPQFSYKLTLIFIIYNFATILFII